MNQELSILFRLNKIDIKRVTTDSDFFEFFGKSLVVFLELIQLELYGLKLMIVFFLSLKKTFIYIFEFKSFWFVNLIKFLILDFFNPKSFFSSFYRSLIILDKLKIGLESLTKVLISLGFSFPLRSQLANISFFSFDISLRLIHLQLMLLFYSLKIKDFFLKALNLNLFLFILIYGSFQIAILFDKLSKTFLLLFNHLFNLFSILSSVLKLSQRLYRRIMILFEVFKLSKEFSFFFDFVLDDF